LNRYNVTDLPLVYGGAPFVAEMPVGELVDAERRALQEQMDLQIARLGLAPEEIQGTTLDLGAAHRVLIEAAERSDSVLIVMGAVESHHTLERLFGSTAGRVVRKADCPVLLVRNAMVVPPSRILLPVDLSELSAGLSRELGGFPAEAKSTEGWRIESRVELGFVDREIRRAGLTATRRAILLMIYFS
jgi:hypothetical protein